MTDGLVMRCELTADLAQVGTARRFVRRNLAGLSEAISTNAQLIASELVTNAVEHGSGGRVLFALRRDERAVALTVESEGPSPGVRGVDDWKIAPAENVTGRGLGIVRSVADRVDVTRRNGWLVITASLAV